MNKKIYSLPIILIIIAIGLLLFYQTNTDKPVDQSSTKDNKLTISTTIFPLSSIVKEIGGDNVKVVNILPPGASPHTYEPTPDTIAELQSARILFSIGHGADDWVRNLVSQPELDTLKLVYVDNGIKLKKISNEKSAIDLNPTSDHENHSEEQHGSEDPHYWLSGENGIIIAQTVEKELEQLDPDNTEYYRNNLNHFVSDLDKTNLDIKTSFNELPNKNIITHHGAWFYFADAYGLNIVGVFELAPGLEPTANDIAKLQSTIKEKNVGAIFLEPQLSSQTIDSFIADTGVKVGVLDPIGGVENRMSYIELLQYNAQIVKNALK